MKNFGGLLGRFMKEKKRAVEVNNNISVDEDDAELFTVSFSDVKPLANIKITQDLAMRERERELLSKYNLYSEEDKGKNRVVDYGSL